MIHRPPGSSSLQGSMPATAPPPKPLIKKIKTSHGLYIYDTWTNEILQVDDTVFSILSDHAPEIDFRAKITDSGHKRALKEIAAAKGKGFFREDHPEIESFPEEHLSDIVNDALLEGPEHLILNITERCNLRCRYCVYSGAYDFDRTHSERVMSWETAKRALDWYFDHKGRSEFGIGFYGGEPLTAFPMIQQIVAYARRQKRDAVRFNLTTNGTLLSEEISRFFIDADFRVTFSLDGPAWVHDRYRVFRNGRGTFSRVWEGILRLYALDEAFFNKAVSFSMVLAPPVQLKAINDFVGQNPEIFENKSIMLAPVNSQSSSVWAQLGVERPGPRSRKERLESVEVFEEFEGSLRQAGKPSGFSYSFHASEYVRIHQRPMNPMPQKTASHGQCIPGKRKCFVDTGGDLFMCEKVNPAYKIGDVRSGLDADRVTALLRVYNRFFKDQCRGCWAVRLCGKCYNNVREGEEWSVARGEAFCRAERARVHRLLTRYCNIREQRDDAFAWAEDIEIV